MNKLRNLLLVGLPTLSLMTAFSGCTKEDTNQEKLSEVMFTVDELKNNVNESTLLMMYDSDISDETLKYIPSYTENLYFSNCHYLTDLSNLNEICPNLKGLYIYSCSSITDLSFVYELNNLTDFYINDSAYVDDNLIYYLNMHGISHNLDDKAVYYAQYVDDIISNTITDNMTDIEKIRAITMYIMDNYEYDMDLSAESNINPLPCMIDNKRGVCAGYAYLANVLLRKAGIESYQVIDHDHTWNLVKLDDKYYYLDVTTLDDDLLRYNVRLFNHSPLFLSDPSRTSGTTIPKYDAGLDYISIPDYMVADIKRGEDNKDIIDKYTTDLLIFYLHFTIPPIMFISLLDQINYINKRKAKNKILELTKNSNYE